MFTGIVEEVGSVRTLAEGDGIVVLEIDCKVVVADARQGDSISVNGCCLTVTALDDSGFTCDMMGETLARTALAGLGPGSPVNLERAVRPDSRLGGHLVQGHVDAVATVAAIQPEESWTVMTFRLPDGLARYVAEKGSVTLDGVSLTVMAVGEIDGAPSFSIGLIPHTLAVTTLGQRQPGDRVNIEVDIVAKYVERMLQNGVASPYSPQDPLDAPRGTRTREPEASPDTRTREPGGSQPIPEG